MTAGKGTLPGKIMGEFPGMTPIEKLEADFRRLARVARKEAEFQEYLYGRNEEPSGWSRLNAIAVTYIVAAEKVRRVRASEGKKAT